MAPDGWRIEAEMTSGEVSVTVAERPALAAIDRIHYGASTSIGMWLSARAQNSRGRFLHPEGNGGRFAQLGSIVAVPATTTMQVLAGPEPARRMVHCRLPLDPALDPQGPAPQLAACLDVRHPVIASSLARLAREAAAPGFASEVIVESLGLFVAAELARHLQAVSLEAPGPRGGLAPWQLKRINEHLNAGNWGCSINQLAILCGISPSHAMRAFRQSTGRTIAVHVAEARIARARELLARDTVSIAEIAGALQFAHPSSFAAAFRRSTGVSPQQYRQRHRIN